MGKSVYLYVPERNELWYRKQIMSDPETMSYNRGYEEFEGYNKETGCIELPETEWAAWYDYFVGNEPQCFYAYVVRKNDNTFIGEVNLHKSAEYDWHEMGIVIEAKYRGEGYATEALRLLVKHGFDEMHVNAIHNMFEVDRAAAIRTHISAGFQQYAMHDNLVELVITSEQYKGKKRNYMIRGKDVILRDFKESDIEKRIYWETVETEWQQWDAPWEYEGLTEAEKESELQEYIQSLHRWVKQDSELPDDRTRYRFQIVLNNEQQDYIGWCNAYCIDEDCNYTDDAGYCTVGIDIPELAVRGKGYATQALCMFIKYLLEHGETPIFTQTWSGNHRMIHIAEKIGFEECRRKKDLRVVRGERYDGLTFRLNIEKFERYMKGNK